MTCKRLFSNGVVAGAIAALMTTLSGATASADPYCEQYAQRAVEHVAQARANNCGYTGKKNWHSNAARHYQFCVDVGKNEAATYERGRAQAIATCIANKKKGSVGTWKGTKDTKSDAKCRRYGDQASAIAREIRRLCKPPVNAYPGDHFRKSCLLWPPNQRNRTIEGALASLQEMKATCARR